MIRLHRKECDSEIFKKALGNLLKRKEYHVAAPTKKNQMLRSEYTRLINKEKDLGQEVLFGKEREKRAFKRKPINLYANFFYRSKSYTGTVINISKKGMGIETMKCLPLKSKFEILIRKKGFSSILYFLNNSFALFSHAPEINISGFPDVILHPI